MLWNRNIVGGVAIGWKIKGSNSWKGRGLSSPKFPDWLWGPASLISVDIRVISLRWGVKLKAVIHPVPRLIISVAVLPLYAFMEWRGKTIPSAFCKEFESCVRYMKVNWGKAPLDCFKVLKFTFFKMKTEILW